MYAQIEYLSITFFARIVTSGGAAENKFFVLGTIEDDDSVGGSDFGECISGVEKHIDGVSGDEDNIEEKEVASSLGSSSCLFSSAETSALLLIDSYELGADISKNDCRE